MTRTHRLASLIAAVAILMTCTVSSWGGGVPGLLKNKKVEKVSSDLMAVIPRLMKEGRIPGLQVVVIRDGRVSWHRNFGVRNAKTTEPVTDDVIFEAASFTKPFFAYYVMKLVEQGLLDLDKPLIGYLAREDIEKLLGHPLDENGFHRDWFERITARQALSHSSGMPHGESGRPYPLLFEPGTKWKYSSEGYFYLQRVVERIKGDKLENLMQKEVLDALGMTRSCLVWRDDYEKTMANGHGFFGTPEEFRKRTESHAAATLYTTAQDYAKFLCAVLNGTGLRPETLAQMLTPQIEMDKDKDKGLGWCLGFGTQTDANGQAIWQWGDFGIFRNFVIAYPKERMGLIYLTNSAYGLGIGPDMVKHSLGGQDLADAALKYRPYDSPVYQLGWKIEAKGPRAAGDLKGLMRKHPDIFDRDAIGFLVENFQSAGKLPEAIAILEVNLKAHPQSGSAHMGLAQAYLAKGDRAQAGALMEKARTAVEDKVDASVIDWNMEYIRALDNPIKLDEDYLKKVAGDYGARHLQFKEGRLFYYREAGTYPEPRPLCAMTKDTFFIEGVSNFRLRVEFDDKGDPAKLVGLYDDGRRDETPRNK
jgi:CubicO group peptidase (beta-lactamase class C family)